MQAASSPFPRCTTDPTSSAKLSTAELAAGLRVMPHTIRAGFCRHGNYMGLIPVKLPNGRLLWPADALRLLTAPKKQEGGQ